MTTILVCTPGDAVSGGPELQHQLVRALIDLGHDAKVCYYPFDKTYECPPPYRHYGVEQAAYRDGEDIWVIISEVSTPLIKFFPRARVTVWWMSVDNYFQRKKESRFKDFYMHFKSLRADRLSLGRLKRYDHIVQSDYATTFLKSVGMPSKVVSDYLNAEHLADREQRPREDVILFNPKKGRKKTAALRARYPDWTFVGLENMTPADLAGWFQRAKVYIDFGPHPGKDRMPREAAIAGCCVITGREGSAAFHADVPIPAVYKLNDKTAEFVGQFGPLVSDIFADFERHSTDFDAYRAMIRAEPAMFLKQVREAFGAA